MTWCNDGDNDNNLGSNDVHGVWFLSVIVTGQNINHVLAVDGIIHVEIIIFQFDALKCIRLFKIHYK